MHHRRILDSNDYTASGKRARVAEIDSRYRIKRKYRFNRHLFITYSNSFRGLIDSFRSSTIGTKAAHLRETA